MMPYKEDAVSPVVGVMLMLVVTIIIAAIVSAFAGGLAGTTAKAPQASLTAKGILPDAGNQTVFTHNGGDAFDLKDVRVMFQSQDTKTTLTMADIGTNCIAFQKSGNTASTMIKPGDSFVITGTKASWGTGITYGSLTLTADSKVLWNVIDKASGNAIAKGEIIL